MAGAELAAAVSEAGGLGTLGMMPPSALKRALQQARSATGKPVAVNVLLPFARPGHWEVAAGRRPGRDLLGSAPAAELRARGFTSAARWRRRWPPARPGRTG